MAPLSWSNLPKDILILISRILNTDVEILRLRSVCSSWRSSILPRHRPSPFPLKLPPISSDCNEDHCLLKYTTLYHLYPPKYGPHAADPSNGWLIRVLEVNPNKFSLAALLLHSEDLEFHPGTAPKGLNLLDYRISEVCKCYYLLFDEGQKPKKIIALWDYGVDCEFVVLALSDDSCMKYWKFGDKEWTPIYVKDHFITDVIAYEGKFYAIGRQAVLLSFDYEFNLIEVKFPSMCVDYVGNDNYLVEYKSDLYVFSKVLEYLSDSEEDNLDDFYLRFEIFKKGDDWERIESLGDGLFLSAEDFSVGVSAEDFRSLEGNRVYFEYNHLGRTGYYEDIFYFEVNLDDDGINTIIMMNRDPNHVIFYWPPPKWLISS